MSEVPQKKNNRGVVPEGERCQGWSRTENRPCRQRRVPGTNYCHYHGGKNRKGTAHPNFKDGARSKYMPPPELLGHYLRHGEDPNLTSHRHAVALVDTLIDSAFSEYDDAPGPEVWKKLTAAIQKMTKARDKGDKRRLLEALSDIEYWGKRGALKSSKRKEIAELADRRRKLANSETRRLVLEAQTITVEQFGAVLRAIGEIVHRHVLDPSKGPEETLAAIENDWVAITGGDQREGPGTPDAD